MGKNPRVNGHNLSRLTISGGKHTEPRLMMAHPMGETKSNRHQAVVITLTVLVIAAIVAIALAGRSS